MECDSWRRGDWRDCGEFGGGMVIWKEWERQFKLEERCSNGRTAGLGAIETERRCCCGVAEIFGLLRIPSGLWKLGTDLSGATAILSSRVASLVLSLVS